MEQRIFDWKEHVTSDFSVKPDVSAFTHLRAFHGCRPLALESYYEKGILVMPLAELQQQFREMFSDFSPEALDRAIGKITRRDDEWRVDAALDLRFLTKHASHYIVQGSETLKAFAVHLPMIDGKDDPRERLKTVGVPTVFVIDAPIDEVDRRTVDELDERLSLLAERGVYEACDDGDLIDFTVSFPNGIPSEWLTGHKTIHEATDPSNRSRRYYYSE